MSDSVRDLLVRGIAAAKDGAKAEARRYLEWALRLDPTDEQRARAWLWLSEVSDDPAEKREYIERILAFDPTDPVARRKLAVLDGRLRPEDIIDPDRLVVAGPGTPQPAQARQFVCPQCGGRMVFDPQGRLICEYCEQRQASPVPSVMGGRIEEQDFILTLATARGHTRAVATRCLRCHACGAAFVLPPETLSFACPYCASTYAVEQAEVQELLPPAAIIPFAVDRAEAQRAVARWLRSERLEGLAHTIPLTGLYLPAWTFDVRCDVSVGYQGQNGYTPDKETVFENDVPVSASRTLPETLAEEVNHFRLEGLLPYDPRYLAGWPAETYRISMADASLVARQKTLARARQRFASRWDAVMGINKMGMPLLAVESFRLILLPLWIACYRDGERMYSVIVNGQTGAVRGEKPEQGARKWLSWLTGEKRDPGVEQD
jgi:DNA-directed RNA polymerase subunit RPC12/RpoP